MKTIFETSDIIDLPSIKTEDNVRVSSYDSTDSYHLVVNSYVNNHAENTFDYNRATMRLTRDQAKALALSILESI